MFNNLAIDVALGLVFIYLLYGLLASILQELIARLFHLRARYLIKALRRMLEDDLYGLRGWWGRFIIFNWFYELGQSFRFFFFPFHKSPVLKKFYDDPAIHLLGKNTASARPSYISAQLFSQTMLHLLRQQVVVATEGQPGRPVIVSFPNDKDAISTNLITNSLQLAPKPLEHLRNLFHDAGQDVQPFRQLLEQWFDETMSRASGWYRRQTQSWLLLIGLGMAAALNVDSIAIARILMKDKNAREQLVQLATSRQQTMGQAIDTLKARQITGTKSFSGNDSTYRARDNEQRIFMADTSLIGVYGMLNNDVKDAQNILGVKRANALLAFNHPYQQSIRLVLLGWLITAMAISLGAPFWFDLLNRVIKFRSPEHNAAKNDNND